jgi:hypothetical protein
VVGVSDADPGGDGSGDGVEDPTPAPADVPAAGSAEDAGTGGADDGGHSGGSRVRRGIDYALLAGLGLLAFVAVVQFYLAVDATITQWVTREYRAPFRAVFNLAVLLVAGAGIYRQLDRMGVGGSDA